MTTTKHLLEAAVLASESAAEDGTWRVKVISEGKGSSGTYTADLLEKHHHAFDDLLSFKNHPGMWDGPETRDFTMITGEVIGETWVDTDERGLKAVYANYLPDPEYREKLDRYKSKLGLSIYIEGSGYVEESTGEFMVDWFNPEDPYASLDVVIAPGARGKFMESMRKTYEARESAAAKKPGTDASVQEENERNQQMIDEQKILDALAALEEKFDKLASDKQAKESEKAQVEADDAAVEARVAAIASALDAVEAARDDLLPPQVESLRAEAKKGADVAPLIEDAKKIKEAAIEAARVVEAAPGRDFSGETTLTEYKLKGFGN